MEYDDVYKIVSTQKERGADICKIVTAANSESELRENFKTSARLSTELGVPYLFLCVGDNCFKHRRVAPFLSSVIIPMAKAFGIRVITTVLTEEIANSIGHLNADRVVVTTKEDIAEVLKEELENGHPVDVAIDCLGGEIMGKCIHYLKHGARWIMIAALAGTKTEIDLKNIYVRNVRIIGSTLRSRTPEVKAQILAELVKNVWPKVSTGEVKPTIYKVLPITEAEAAHDILYKGQNVGKVVLTVE